MRRVAALFCALLVLGCAASGADAAAASKKAGRRDGAVLLETMRKMRSLKHRESPASSPQDASNGVAVGDQVQGGDSKGYRFSSASASASQGNQVHASSTSGTTAKNLAGSDCKICIYVLERIKQGYQYLLPSICVEIWSKTQDTASYGKCHNVLASLSVWGHNVRHWMQFGCYKTETYGAMELVKPCPSHVICSQMANLEKKNFCAPETPYEPA